jgi:hypothetical protein
MLTSLPKSLPCCWDASGFSDCWACVAHANIVQNVDAELKTRDCAATVLQQKSHSGADGQSLTLCSCAIQSGSH